MKRKLFLLGGIMFFSRAATGFLPKKLLFYARQRSILITTTTVVTPGTRHASSTMEHLYKEWTLTEDETLWRYHQRQETTEQLASRLGRGLRGVQARLSKLQDVDSAAYQRLFVAKHQLPAVPAAGDDPHKPKLMPAGEVLRRIQWDHSLDEQNFSIRHYDRVDDTILESPFTARNEDIAGAATQLVDALPEHRIVGIKYKERVVWDRQERLDLVFGPPGIMEIMKGYDEWWRRVQEEKEMNRKRQAEVASHLQRVLGLDNFEKLKGLSASLVSSSESGLLVARREVEGYVKNALKLFSKVRTDPSASLDPSAVPMSDYEALDMLSELVVLMPNESIRTSILGEISAAMAISEGKKIQLPKNRPLPPINEEDLVEEFIKGGGRGGQKINKTASCVDLLHKPTQIRVQVQDTRSLQQNRKIARKRLREKLDEFLNGSQSKKSMAQAKSTANRRKAKARNRARHRRKQEAKEQELQEENE